MVDADFFTAQVKAAPADGRNRSRKVRDPSRRIAH
jgi:hypothetical protein